MPRALADAYRGVDAPLRVHPLRELLNGLRGALRAGGAWRVPNDLPPSHAVHRQAQRWTRAGCFGAAHDLREILGLKAGRHAPPTAAILDGRVLRSMPESGHRAGHGGAKRTKGGKVRLAVDTLGCPLTLFVMPASVDERNAVDELARRVQEETGESIELAHVDQGYAGESAASRPPGARDPPGGREAARSQEGPRAPARRWVVERSFAWSSRFKRLGKDDERLPETLAGFHVLAFCALILGALAPWIQGA